jgi:hypothetical protein
MLPDCWIGQLFSMNMTFETQVRKPSSLRSALPMTILIARLSALTMILKMPLK